MRSSSQQHTTLQQVPNDMATTPIPVIPNSKQPRVAAAAAVPACQRAPLEVLLAPLLPSADESKVLDRLSQTRVALDEQLRLVKALQQQVPHGT